MIFYFFSKAFSNQLFYNQDTGYFEQVHSDGEVCWDGDVTPSSSLSTLYLPDHSVGEVSLLFICWADQ